MIAGGRGSNRGLLLGAATYSNPRHALLLAPLVLWAWWRRRWVDGLAIAVALVLSANYEISLHILEPGGNTIAANIATRYGEAGQVGRGALIASGLVLFIITLIVNFGARSIVGKNGRGGAS